MKRLVLLLTALLAFYSVAIGHPINAYKYIIIEQKGNIYDVEDRLAEMFTRLGFTVLANGEEDGMLEEKYLMLHLDYGWEIRYGAPSELQVALINDTGKVVYKSVTSGMALTAAGDMRAAINKLEMNLNKLHYKFEPPTTNSNPNNSDINLVNVHAECASWSVDSIRVYLRDKSVNSIEGIYKNLSGDNFTYRFAIIKEGDLYYGIIIESNNKLWQKGMIKLTLSHIERNLFDIEMFNERGYQTSCIGRYSNRILEITTNNATSQFIKTYPSSSSSAMSDGQGSDAEVLSAMGSGILISGKIIATNYHVIENAESIKISLFHNGAEETYDGRVLVTDKTNDLALLSIKDSGFKGLPPAPFSLSENTVDVGTSVFTMGYPMATVLGSEVKVTDGIISAKSGYEGDITTYQISAPIQPGNSGGALFDKKGNLIGITNAGVTGADNVGYAIKTSYLLNLIESSPIDIDIPKGGSANDDLPTLIKQFKPYVAIIKVY